MTSTDAEDTAAPAGRARWLRWAAVVALAGGAFWLLKSLPFGQWIADFSNHVERMGTGGMALFVLVYILAALLFVPGAAITLAAGALFGLVQGTILVSIASTVAAALAFLIGRHVARDRIVKLAEKAPRFAAIDQAIGQGGWRIIALLRLSPALPFSLGNYLYGLTAVRFVPYVVTSWVAMLPGTFLYVYLGHIGRAGAEAGEGEGGRTPAEWALLGVGLLATIIVTVYVTKLAKRAMDETPAAEALAKD